MPQMSPPINILRGGSDCSCLRGRPGLGGGALAAAAAGTPRAVKHSSATCCTLSAASTSSPSYALPPGPGACRKPYPHLLILTEHSSNLSLSPIKSSSCQGIPHISKEVGQERSREGETTILAVGLPSLPLCLRWRPLRVLGPFRSSC